jgi:2-phosphosulfolactate phosphatase
MKKLEVYLTPEEYLLRNSSFEHLVVVVDILRATTSICTAIDSGVLAILPVSSVEEAKAKKAEGYIVASERNSIKLDFADLGNSPLGFTLDKYIGKELVLSTTNGTNAIDNAKKEKAKEILIGSFLNLESLAQHLLKKEDNVIILCSGWKGVFNLEDSLFAGALASLLLQDKEYKIGNDAVQMSVLLWQETKSNLLPFISQTDAYKRLTENGLEDEMEYIFTLNQISTIPVLRKDRIVAN